MQKEMVNVETTNSYILLHQLIEGNNCILGRDFKVLLKNYFNNDYLVGELPEFLSYFGQREHMNDIRKDWIVNNLEDDKYYKLTERIITTGLFQGKISYVPEIVDNF